MVLPREQCCPILCLPTAPVGLSTALGFALRIQMLRVTQAGIPPLVLRGVPRKPDIKANFPLPLLFSESLSLPFARQGGKSELSCLAAPTFPGLCCARAQGAPQQFLAPGRCSGPQNGMEMLSESQFAHSVPRKGAEGGLEVSLHPVPQTPWAADVGFGTPTVGRGKVTLCHSQEPAGQSFPGPGKSTCRAGSAPSRAAALPPPSLPPLGCSGGALAVQQWLSSRAERSGVSYGNVSV